MSQQVTTHRIGKLLDADRKGYETAICALTASPNCPSVLVNKRVGAIHGITGPVGGGIPSDQR